MNTRQSQKQWKRSAGIICCLLCIVSSFGVLGEPKGARAEATQHAELSQQLQQLLDKTLADSDTQTPGSVLLIRTPDFQFVGASGLADITRRVPMRPTDMLRIGSMTKTFVSTVILKLSEEGKLDPDEPINTYLPKESARIAYGDVMTIRQLLNMTSGLVEYMENDAYLEVVETRPYRQPWTAAEILEYVYDEEADFEPGTDFQYTNTNYVLLEKIVENVSGRSLAEEMRRVIFEPSGITTTFMEMRESRPGGSGGLQVRGYDTTESPTEDITEENDGLGLGDGGLISDVQGIAAFLNALFLERTLLDEGSLAQMTNDILGEEYGLGLEAFETDFGVTWGHEGKSCGFQSLMQYLPDQQTIIVILTNEENEDSDVIEELVTDSLNIIFDVQ